jgi:hypothetical protein
MAYLATLQLLIDAESESDATVLSSDIASQLQADGQVLDWSVKDARAVNDTVRDSIANETYVSGECFGEYIVVSTTKRPQDASFWSNTYGWTAYDLATRFDATVADLPKAVQHESAAFFLDRGPASMLAMVSAR